MAYSFGDSFDLYAVIADMNGYWDTLTSGIGGSILPAGRFTGSQALGVAGLWRFVKSSGVNDPVHHLCVAYKQVNGFGSATASQYFTLYDGTTAQCTILFRLDGSLVLQSGAPGGTILATYSSAVSAVGVWYHFEFEVSIHNTTGTFKARRDGATSDSFSATGLNTRTSANNYANKLLLGNDDAGSLAPYLDDLFWQSGASAGTWLGDIRCYTRMPASDVGSNVFSVFGPNPAVLQNVTPNGANSVPVGYIAFASFIPLVSGTVGTVSFTLSTTITGHTKAAIYDSTHQIVLGTSAELTNPVAGTVTFTFASPVAVVAGTTYWFAHAADVAYTTSQYLSIVTQGYNPVSYSLFPQTSPGAFTTNVYIEAITVNITSPAGTFNFAYVSDIPQNALTSYVYAINPGDTDFYNLASIPSTPLGVIGVTTRGFMEKSSAGSKTASMQLKSGGTTVATSTLTLSTSWLWAWRMDLTNPATGAAWTPASVNAAQIGPKVVA